MELSLRQTDPLAAGVTTAESSAKRLADEEQEVSN